LYQRLFESVGEFLRKKTLNRNVGPSEINPQTGLPPPIFLGTGNKILEAIDVFKNFKIHRIYLVEQNYRPVGVVTPAEILSVFSKRREGGGFP
jgi:hypothetical protein